MTKCKKCKSKLKDVGIGLKVRGNMFYHVSLGGKIVKFLAFDTDEFVAAFSLGKYFCCKCGAYLHIPSETVLKILTEGVRKNVQKKHK